MKSYKTISSSLALALVVGWCLAANGLTAAENPSVSSAPKPAAQAATHTVSSSTQHPIAKKATGSATTAHSTYHPATVPTRTVAAHPGAMQYAASKSATHPSSTSPARTAPAHASAYASQHGAASARSRYGRPATVSTLNGWQRLARLHLQPERVQEIQQALIREGYLQGEPTGQWDTKTHDAMLRFQAEHGFPTTGLPEAKSLMKLGLGSHPLPAELDHGPVANATPAPTQSVFTVTPAAPTSASGESSSQVGSPAQN